MEIIKRNNHIIDATNKSLGRLASEIAVLLRGKDKADFFPYKDMGDFVLIKNIAKIKFTGKKLENEKRYYHSGFLGSLKELPLGNLFKEKPEKVLREAVMGMLPKNKLRAKMIKRLKIEP